jgi:hypothetical protein
MVAPFGFTDPKTTVDVVADMTLDETHKSKWLVNKTANTYTATVPLDATVPYPIGSEIAFGEWSTGRLLIGSTAGLTFNSPEGVDITAGFPREVLRKTVLRKTGVNTWRVEEEKIISGWVKLPVVTASGLLTDITSAVSTALLTGADDGSALLNVVSSGAIGVIASGTNNKCKVYDSANREIYAFGEEVYGRVTFAASVYTLSYFYEINGVETAYNLGAIAQLLKVETPYRFPLYQLPKDAIVAMSRWRASNASFSGTPFKITVKTDNAGTSATNQFTLPLNSAYSYDFLVDWGDGLKERWQSSVNPTHTYSAIGTYTISIWGVFPAIYFNYSNDCEKALTVNQWGSSVDWLGFNSAFSGCSNLLFSTTSIDSLQAKTDRVLNFIEMYSDCTSATTFPLINTASGTDFNSTYAGCTSATMFPLINTASGTNFSYMYYGCTSATTFPLINTASGTNFSYMYYNCTSATTLPLINTASGNDFSGMYYNCTSATTFPLINTASGNDFNSTYAGCTSATTFPLINTASGTNFSYMYAGCTLLQLIPSINMTNGTTLSNFVFSCPSLNSILATGIKTSFSVAGTALTASALNTLYGNLATVVGQTINVTSTPGAAGDNPAIATTKGWTVVG